MNPHPYPVRALLAAALLVPVCLSAFPLGANLYVQPTSSPFIEMAGETVTTLSDSSGSIATAQAAINAAHTANPSAIVVMTLHGTYSVSSAALNLTSNTCLVLASGTVIKAASASITPTTLIQIHGQNNVSVAGGTFNGEGASVNAVQIETSNRVNIDDIAVSGCGRDGIYLTGNGTTTFDNENTVTRCTVSGGTSNGIKLQSATQVVCIDNLCTSNAAAGIYLNASHCTVTNNTCNSNATGITVTGSQNVISDNALNSNATGISLTSTSTNNTVASNHPYSSTTVGIAEAGTGDTIFENYYKLNAADFTSGGTANNVVAYKAALSAPGQNYFFPPIFENQHTTTTIVNGLGRFDLTIGATTIASVQSTYNAAVTAHPSTVIVLHLTGATYTLGASPLTLSADTCVLLTGTIDASSSTAATAIQATNVSNISVSGGTISAGGRVMKAITFSGCTMSNIDNMTFNNFGPQTPRNASGDVLAIGDCNTPCLVRNCTIATASGRGIHTSGHSGNAGGAKGVYIIEGCTISNCGYDAVDCDAWTAGSLVKFNLLDNNTRYGIFIEQGAEANQAIGNGCSGNSSYGIGMYNNGEPVVTEYNGAICNACNSNANGLRNGSTGGATTLTSHNFYFNNTANTNTSTGINSQVIGTENYYAQNIVTGNGTDITTSGSEAFFNSSEP